MPALPGGGNYFLQKSSGVGRAIWLVIGTPCQIVSGGGMVTRLPAAVPLQNLLGPGSLIWLVAAVVGGVIGAVRARLVASAFTYSRPLPVAHPSNAMALAS